jgi:hypothetical protein
MGISRVVFFKIRALAHAPIAQTKNTFRDSIKMGIKPLFDNFPLVVFKILLHTKNKDVV